MTTTYSTTQVIQFAQKAGFTGQGLKSIVAIAWAESGFRDTPPDNINSDPTRSHDRGILQINSLWHSEVIDSCAYNPQCAFNAAFKISNSGTNFTPWATYNSPVFHSFLSTDPTINTVVVSNATTTPRSMASGHIFSSIATATSTTNSATSGYKWIVAYGVAAAIFVLITKTKLGYATMYYLLVLSLLFLLVTQSKFISEALAPISNASAPMPITTPVA